MAVEIHSDKAGVFETHPFGDFEEFIMDKIAGGAGQITAVPPWDKDARMAVHIPKVTDLGYVDEQATPQILT